MPRKPNNLSVLIEDALKKKSVSDLSEAQRNLLRLCQLMVDINRRAIAKDNKNA